MKNCPKCGAPVNDTAKFCPVCGGACAAPEQPQQNTQEFAQQSQQQYQQASQQQTYQQPQYQAPQPSYDPYDHTAEFTTKDISENKVIAMLCYLMGTFGVVLALLGSVGRSPSELDVLYLCGGFASALDLASARSTGLLPAVAPDRIRICGNTSLAAAIQAAADPEILDQFESERSSFRDIPLNNLPEFEELYTRSLALN